MAGSRWVLQGKPTQAQPGVDLGEIVDRISAFALANLLWVLLAVPIVTLPAATAGLFAAVSPWSRGKTGELFYDFSDGMRRHWRKSTIVLLLDVAFGGLVIINFSIFRLMNIAEPLTLISQSVTIFVGVLALLVNLYVWPLMVLFDLPVDRLISTALHMVFSHPLRSILTLATGLMPLLLGLFLPAIITLMLSVSTCALLISKGAWGVIRLYTADD
jgi:uncharacterized membrane protein YesL